MSVFKKFKISFIFFLSSREVYVFAFRKMQMPFLYPRESSQTFFSISSKIERREMQEKKSNLHAGLRLNFHTDIGFSEAENSKLGKLPLEPSN